MFFTFAMTTDAVGSVIPKIIEEFALSLTAAGAFQYASMAGIGAGALLLGFLADRIGHKRATIERILEHLGPRSNAKIHRARTTTDRGGSALMPGSTDTPLPGSPAPRQLTEGPLYALSANNTGFRDLSANSAGSPGMTVIRG
jgi:hypothetical protein